MKFTLFKTILIPLAAAAAASSDENRELADMPAVLGGDATPCVYPEGAECSDSEFCQIPVGHCRLKIATVDGVCTAKPEMCMTIYDPVCGCDGVTYGSACNAEGAGVNIEQEGACLGDYCARDADTNCWKGGFPQCCLEADQPCPSDRVPRCDTNDAMGSDYCTWSPDEACYPSNNGHPECCARFDGTNCPPEQPNCEIPPEVSAVKFLRG